MAKPVLTIEALIAEAGAFAELESVHSEPVLYGISDGKAVGTYLEHKFTEYVARKYHSIAGNSAAGIDFPDLNVDIKVTSIRKPQSSCPFRSARQKIYGLGYHLLVFVYSKTDRDHDRTACLDMQHVIFIDRAKTADFQTTRGISVLLENDANEDDILAFFAERNLPIDEIEAARLAEEVLATPPIEGVLTVSNALQWRLHYKRAIDWAGDVSGVLKIR